MVRRNKWLHYIFSLVCFVKIRNTITIHTILSDVQYNISNHVYIYLLQMMKWLIVTVGSVKASVLKLSSTKRECNGYHTMVVFTAFIEIYCWQEVTGSQCIAPDASHIISYGEDPSLFSTSTCHHTERRLLSI